MRGTTASSLPRLHSAFEGGVEPQGALLVCSAKARYDAVALPTGRT